MAAPFTLIGIDHVVLRAADPAALERFYMEVLGCAFEKRQGSLAHARGSSADRYRSGRRGRTGTGQVEQRRRQSRSFVLADRAVPRLGGRWASGCARRPLGEGGR